MGQPRQFVLFMVNPILQVGISILFHFSRETRGPEKNPWERGSEKIENEGSERRQEETSYKDTKKSWKRARKPKKRGVNVSTKNPQNNRYKRRFKIMVLGDIRGTNK